MFNYIKTKIASAYNWIKEKIKWIVLTILGIGIAMAALPTPPPDTSFQDLEKVEKTGEKYKIKVNEDPTEEMEIEIGGNGADFMPEAKLKKWGDETFVKIKYKTTKKIKPEQKDGKLKWKDKDEEVHFETTEDAFKFIPVFKKKPATNVIELEIETQGLDFFYQPELTQEEIDNGAFRPEHIVGSWAVYHSTQAGDYSLIGGKNYRAGKFGHIERPRLKDSNGWEVWGDLFIDAENGIYRITIPTDFYENAVYPIRSNDTFGFDEIGGTETGTNVNNRITGSQFTGVAGTVTDIRFYNKQSGPDPRKCAIYLHSNLSLINNGSTIEDSSNTAPNWVTLTFSTNPTISAVDYVLVVWADQAWPTAMILKYDDGVGTTQGHYQSLDYSDNSGNFPATMTATHEDRKYSIYCTYTADEAEEEAEDFLIIFN